MNQKTKKMLMTDIEQTLTDLKHATLDIDVSGTWALYDYYGGTLATKLLKHNKIKETVKKIDVARFSVQNLASEVTEIEGENAFGIDWSFAEGFLDLPAEEWMDEKNAKEAGVQVEAAAEKVRALKSALEKLTPED